MSTAMKTYIEQLSARGSNYEIAKVQAQKVFLKYDQEKVIKKLRLLHDESYIFFTFVSKQYRISRKTGEIVWTIDDFMTCYDAGFNETLTIFDILCYSKEDARASGVFVNMKSLSTIHGSSSSLVGGGLFRKYAEYFDEKDEALSYACEQLHGIKTVKGDVSYEIPLFVINEGGTVQSEGVFREMTDGCDCQEQVVSMKIQFWDSDDEFPASLEIFLDENILDYMRYETVWYAVSHLLELIYHNM